MTFRVVPSGPPALVLQQHSVIPEAASVMRFTGVGLAAASPA